MANPADDSQNQHSGHSHNDDKEHDKDKDKHEDNKEKLAIERARALLEATHAFPCEYFLMVIARSDDSITERLVAAVNQATGRALDASGKDVILRPSAGGKYVSHRFSVQVQHAGEVLRLYEVVKGVAGVITVM
jgi:putative lipoic acid-binding regulatory protein